MDILSPPLSQLLGIISDSFLKLALYVESTFATFLIEKHKETTA